MALAIRGALPWTSPLRLAAILAIIPTFIVLQWLIVRNAAIAIASDDNPALVIRLRPVSEKALLVRLAQVDISTEEKMQAVKAAAVAAPISGRPYLAAARIIPPGGAGTPGALPYLRAGCALSPRDALIRLTLIENYARAQNWIAALDEADAAMRLDARLAQRMAPFVGMLARTPGAKTHLATLVRANPPWQRPFLMARPNGGMPMEAVFRSLSSLLDEQSAPGTMAQRDFIRGLIAQRRYELAYLAFLNFLPEGAVERVRSVYDGRFEGLPGPPPFNWSFFRQPEGFAELTPGRPGLSAHVAGFGAVTLARQTMALPPGDFRLDTNGVPDRSAPGTFIWNIRCLGSRTNLISIDMAEAQARGPRTVFAVPSVRCGLQEIMLAAEFRDVDRNADARISLVDIVPANSGE